MPLHNWIELTSWSNKMCDVEISNWNYAKWYGDIRQLIVSNLPHNSYTIVIGLVQNRSEVNQPEWEHGQTKTQKNSLCHKVFSTSSSNFSKNNLTIMKSSVSLRYRYVSFSHTLWNDNNIAMSMLAGVGNQMQKSSGKIMLRKLIL